MSQTPTITIGCDPEYFIQNTNNQNFISAHDIIPGTKQKPHKVDKGAVQVDGLAVEFNIEPAKTQKEFVSNIKTVRKWLDQEIKRNYPELTSVITPVAKFPEKYYKNLPQFVKILGCEADFNAYTGSTNESPTINEKEPMRTAAGHVHIGWTSNKDPNDSFHFQNCSSIVQACDGLLYPLSLYWDEDLTRQKLYGKPGAFRPKPYGCEYRVISCKWIEDELLIKTVFKITSFIMKEAFRYSAVFQKCQEHGIKQFQAQNKTIEEQRQIFTDLYTYLPKSIRNYCDKVMLA